VSASGHGSPHSATGLDSGKLTTRDHDSSSGQRSGGQTPKMPTLAPTPTMSAPSLPSPPPPPPPPPLSSMPIAPDASAQMSRLLAVLGEFTNHVSDMASVTMQRENAKKQLAKKAAEYDKWRKQHASFPPLAEQQEKERASAQIEFEELDRKLKQHIGARDKLAQAIAMSVVSNRSGGGGGGGGGESERVQYLERELEVTRTDIQGMKTKLKQASTEYGQIHGIQSKHASIQNQIVDLNHKLDGIVAGLNSRPIVSSTSDNSIINIDKQISKLQGKLVMIQERVDDIPNLKLDVSKSKQEVRDLSFSVNAQVNSLQELKGTILGEKDDKGLIDIIATVEEDVDKLRGALTTTNEDLDNFQSELHKFNGRLATLERGSSRRQTPQPATAITKYDDTELRSGITFMKEEVADLQSGLVTLRREQEEKDELVGDEIDAITKSTSKLDEAVQTNRSDMEAAINRINASLSSLQARPSPPAAVSNSPTPQPLMNGTWKPDDAVGKKIQETLKQHRHVLDRQRETISMLERAWQNLDGRFNSLTTDQLAQNMVHQMSEMYPYAANVQVELDLAKQRHENLRQNNSSISNSRSTHCQRTSKPSATTQSPTSQLWRTVSTLSTPR